MSEAEAAAAGGFVFKTTENGFVVGDKRFADRGEAEAHSTEKKTELAATPGGSQGVARGGQAALPRGYTIGCGIVICASGARQKRPMSSARSRVSCRWSLPGPCSM